MPSLSQVDQLIAQLGDLQEDDDLDVNDRARLKRVVDSASIHLEQPWETAAKIALIQPATYAALKFCRDILLFEKWVKTYRDGRDQSSAQLAEITGVQELLLVRILRHLTAASLLRQRDSDLFALTPFTRALGQGNLNASTESLFSSDMMLFMNLPNHLRRQHYINPENPHRTNWHDIQRLLSFGVEEFSSLYSPWSLPQFCSMETYQRTYWLDLFPVSQIVEYARPNRTVVVDVGGATGEDLEALSEHPSAHLRRPMALVLQASMDTIEHTDTSVGITKMVHDILGEQPIKGARIYYLAGVLHDRSDPQAKIVLERLRDAMEPGYSSILLRETVIGRRPHALNTALDLHMMSTRSSFERTTAMWTQLVESAGLKIENLWEAAWSTESIIEVVIP